MTSTADHLLTTATGEGTAVVEPSSGSRDVRGLAETHIPAPSQGHDTDRLDDLAVVPHVLHQYAEQGVPNREIESYSLPQRDRIKEQEEVSWTSDVVGQNPTTVIYPHFKASSGAIDMIEHEGISGATDLIGHEVISGATDRIGHEVISGATDMIVHEGISRATDMIGHEVISGATDMIEHEVISGATDMIEHEVISAATEMIGHEGISAATDKLEHEGISAATDEIEHEVISGATDKIGHEGISGATDMIGHEGISGATDMIEVGMLSIAIHRVDKSSALEHTAVPHASSSSREASPPPLMMLPSTHPPAAEEDTDSLPIDNTEDAPIPTPFYRHHSTPSIAPINRSITVDEGEDFADALSEADLDVSIDGDGDDALNLSMQPMNISQKLDDSADFHLSPMEASDDDAFNISM
jgi:hypothetical protein